MTNITFSCPLLLTSIPSDSSILSFSTISHKIFETNPDFHVNKCTTGNVSIFMKCFAIINKIFILAERLALGYHSMKFKHFHNVS